MLKKSFSYFLVLTLLFTQLAILGCASHRKVAEDANHSGYVECPHCGKSFEIETHRRSKVMPVTEGAVGFGAVGAIIGTGVGGLIGGIVMAPTIVGIPAGIVAGMAVGAAGGGVIGGAGGGAAVAAHQADALECPYCGAIFDIAKLR